MNKPYVKQTDSNGEVTNPITKDKPFVSFFPNRETRRVGDKYINLFHPITGKFMGRIKKNGNNRKSTSKRRNSRTNNQY